MQPDHLQTISASTRFRYKRAQRQSELKDFLKFKSEFSDVFKKENVQALKKVYNHGIIGRNVNQHTVIIDRVGSIKLSELHKIVTDDQFVGYINQRMLHLSQNVLKEKQEVIWIIDLAGPILQLASKKVYLIIEKITINLQKYFPHLLHKLYFVNTPMLFDTIWNNISQQITEQTQQKFLFIGDEYEELYVDVDPVILPQFLGGNCSNRILQQIEKDYIQKMESPEEDEEEEEQTIDMNELKAALSGLKIGVKNHGSVAQTPLNTENDEYK